MSSLSVHSRRHGVLAVVAREAGVSAATVSKVVHRRRDVSPPTRARVEELLHAHGYVRPWEADHQRPPQLLAIFRDLIGPYTLEVARGIVDGATEVGASAAIGTTTTRSLSLWLDECARLGAAGLVIVISMLTDRDQRRISEQGVPVVLVDPLSEPGHGIPSVGVTNWGGARSAVAHLAGLGHRRIAMLAGRPNSLAGAARLHGYRAGLEEAGLPVDRRMVCATDFDFAESVLATTELLRADPPPTAVFAASDAQALGALEAARRAGRRVPDDLAVVSFDDTAAAATASPPLTAVRQPFEEMGSVATRILLELARGTPPPSMRVELATSLVVRESCGGRAAGVPTAGAPPGPT